MYEVIKTLCRRCSDQKLMLYLFQLLTSLQLNTNQTMEQSYFLPRTPKFLSQALTTELIHCQNVNVININKISLWLLSAWEVIRIVLNIYFHLPTVQYD